MKKGVILAGGSGTRLYPLTKGVNKHLLPVGNKPMILHPVEKLKEVGVENILVITGPEYFTQFAALLGDGSDYGVDLHMRCQQKPGGIAEAVCLARAFTGGDPFYVLLGDNIFEDSLRDMEDYFPLQEEEALVVLKAVPDPERFGIAQLEEDKITDVVEKPKEPRGNLCVTGIYAYTHKVYDIIGEINPSTRGEMEISDVNRFYAQAGKLKHHILKNWWVDAGTPEALDEVNQILRGAQ